MMEDVWLTFVKRMQALAASGLHYTESDYDRERYEEINELATAMIARLADAPVAAIRDLLPKAEEGYATPRIDVRATVVEGGRILLVQEKADGLWTLPGGFADTGLSASENVVKEVSEEAGLIVSADRLYAVTHKARRPYPPDPRDFYKFFFLCRVEGDARPRAGSEVQDARFFDANDLPPLSLGRVIPEDIALAFAAARDPGMALVFD